MLFPNTEKPSLVEIAAKLGWPHKLQPGFVVWQSIESGLFARLLITDSSEARLHVEVGILAEGNETINLTSDFAADGYLIEAWQAGLATDLNTVIREFSATVKSLGDPTISEMEGNDD